MRPLREWSAAARRGITGVFTDIDDTLTTHGAITADALQALHALRAAGIMVIPITGRPIGWCERFMAGTAQQPPWPVDTMVAENGAVAFVREQAPGFSNQMDRQSAWNMREQLSKLYQLDTATRAANRDAMEAVAAQVLREVPQARRTDDGGGRETDLAFDYAEHHRMTPEGVAQVLAVLQRAGMRTTVSSIHIHGCFGDFNKWLGAQWIVRTRFGRELGQELDRWVFVGDSGNDQVMFEHFTHSVGVANIHACAAQLTHLPTYVTHGDRGAGFAEVAQALLAARAAA